ncbi:MAG: hypothetical protein HY319_00975 [Armatimonadetes bacterium]|nr:hypothetical protein [Armatimonadota bacterium]
MCKANGVLRIKGGLYRLGLYEDFIVLSTGVGSLSLPYSEVRVEPYGTEAIRLLSRGSSTLRHAVLSTDDPPGLVELIGRSGGRQGS